MIAQLDDGDGWAPLGLVGQRLANLVTDFAPRTYGHAKLSELVKEPGSFEVKNETACGIYIRCNLSTEQPTEATEAPARPTRRCNPSGIALFRACVRGCRAW